MMPDDGWDMLSKHDAILFGAVGSPDVPDTSPSTACSCRCGGKFDQYVNLRPAYLFDGVPSPLRDKAPGSHRHARLPREHRGRVRPDRRPALRRARRTRSPCRPPSSPAAAASASCGPPSRPPASAARRSRRSPSRTPCSSRHGAVGRGLHGRGARTIPTCRANSLLVDAAAMDFVRKPEVVRRGGGQQPVRRHPDRPERHRHRQHRPGRQRQHQPGADVSRACSSRCTARPRTSPARASPTRWRRSCRRS